LFIKKGDNKGNIILPLSRIHLKNQELSMRLSIENQIEELD